MCLLVSQWLFTFCPVKNHPVFICVSEEMCHQYLLPAYNVMVTHTVPPWFLILYRGNTHIALTTPSSWQISLTHYSSFGSAVATSQTSQPTVIRLVSVRKFCGSPLPEGSRWLRGSSSVYWYSGPGFDSLGSRMVDNNGRFTFALAALGTGWEFHRSTLVLRGCGAWFTTNQPTSSPSVSLPLTTVLLRSTERAEDSAIWGSVCAAGDLDGQRGEGHHILPEVGWWGQRHWNRDRWGEQLQWC